MQCQNCHKEIVAQWRTTKHAQAFQTLVNTRDDAREECLKCHVLGLGTPGGYRPAAPQPTLVDVQCENCHGSAVKHAMAATADRKGSVIGHPDAKVCGRCHNAERDPGFNFKVAWEKIKH